MALIIVDNITWEKAHEDIARHTDLVVPESFESYDEAAQYIDADQAYWYEYMVIDEETREIIDEGY